MAYTRICGIYKITNKINNKVYIGQSVSIKQRWGYHKREARRSSHLNEHFQNAWNKYGEENFDFSILETCEKIELDEKEKHYIKYYNSFNSEFGYNKTSGGDSCKEVSDETKEKLRFKNLYIHQGEKSERAVYTEKQIRLVKELMYCAMNFDEVSVITGVPRMYLTKIKSLERWSSVLSYLNDEIKNIKFDYECTPIFIFNKKMDFICECKSNKEAGLSTDNDVSGVWSCYTFKTVTSKGFVYLKKDEFIEGNIEKKKQQLVEKNCFIVHRVDEDGNIIETFNSISEASKKCGLNYDSVRRICDGANPNINEYKFIKEYCS